MPEKKEVKFQLDLNPQIEAWFQAAFEQFPEGTSLIGEPELDENLVLTFTIREATDEDVAKAG